MKAMVILIDGIIDGVIREIRLFLENLNKYFATTKLFFLDKLLILNSFEI